MNRIMSKMPEVIKDRFRFSTLSFIFIIAYVNIFQKILGPENSIVGVVFAIMMSASMVRDMTATPFKHLCIQALVLVWMALAAYWVNILPSPLSLIINFITLLMILYAFTYEYANHMYFPYILSYLFLIFISPVTDTRQLPKRLLGMLIGAVSIMAYQWVMGRNRVVETARDVLSEIIDDICLYISFRLKETNDRPDPADTRHKLCRLSQTVYDRRKKVLCISHASFSMIDAGRGLEHLLVLLHELPEEETHREKELLLHIRTRLNVFRAFLHQDISGIPPWDFPISQQTEKEDTFQIFRKTLLYIDDRLQHMTDPQNKTHYPKTALSLKVRIQAALDLSPVRAIYALRTALLLSFATLFVQTLALPHGKWLLFTLASVSLPYSDDVPGKIKKRILATLTGGIISVLIYSLVPSPAGRTAAMMLSGYLSFYLSDYTGTFACSTIGALGGAVYMEAFGFQAVGSIFLIRICYILAGALIGYLANCLIFPYSRAKATGQLWKKYQSVTDLLSYVCRSEQTDTQLYYSLVIQAHLQEEKLSQNAGLEDWEAFPSLLAKYREKVRKAHRTHITERADALIFEGGHLS